MTYENKAIDMKVLVSNNMGKYMEIISKNK